MIIKNKTDNFKSSFTQINIWVNSIDEDESEEQNSIIFNLRDIYVDVK